MKAATAHSGDIKNDLRRWAEEWGRVYQWEEAAQLLIEAYLEMPSSLCQKYIEDNPPNALTVAILIRLAAKHGATKGSRKGGQARAAKTAAAKERVQATWKLTGKDYKGKADFARIYSPLLLQEEVKVTVRQIADEWLKGL